MTYRFDKLSRPQQDYARRIAQKSRISVSQVAKYLDDFAAWDRGEIDATELKTRTGHQVES